LRPHVFWWMGSKSTGGANINVYSNSEQHFHHTLATVLVVLQHSPMRSLA
jgi:hypothetical protein